MLAFRLAPARDETLHSLVARHGLILGTSDAAALGALFFGRTATVVSADYSCGLECAAGQLGFRDGGELLVAHTMHPYSTAFAKPEHRRAAEAWALRGEGRQRGAVGVTSNLLRPRPVLAFCDQCVRERDGTGTAHAWKRAHQLPGAFVCHRHGDPLRVTNVDRAGRKGARAFAALTDEVVRSSPRAVRHARRDAELLLRYARNGERLLHERGSPGIPELQRRIHALLDDFRWERAGTLFAMSRLVSTLVDHPSVAPLLRAMGLRWPEAAWATALNGLLRRQGAGKHPLLVLMLLETVGADLDHLLGASRPDPSWIAAEVGPARPGVIELCANPACTEVRSEAAQTLASVPPGTRAACPRCGFAVRSSYTPGARPTITATCASWDTAVAGALSDPRVWTHWIQ